MSRVASITQDQKELAYEYAITGISLAKTAESLGFKSIWQFNCFCEANPEFKNTLYAARNNALPHMEDKMLAIKDTCTDPKLARVEMECLARVMSYRDPGRYGNRVDVNVHQTLDISGSLARIDAQIATTYRDVTPQIEKPKEINDLL